MPSRTPRVYLDRPIRTGDEITLPEPATRHLVRVLRAEVGAPIVLFNGEGGEFSARITRVGRDRGTAHATVETFSARERESPLEVGLAQAISRASHMDYSLQKAVELGVRWVQPLLTSRGVVRLEGTRMDRRLAHWRGVAASATEQCGRNRIPLVHDIVPIRSWLAEAPDPATKLILAPDANRGLVSLAPARDPVVVLIGPEAGLTAEETRAAIDARFLPVTLGPRVLRTETATAAAIAAIQVLWGDLG